MLGTLIDVFDRLEPLLLVGLGAILQPLVSSLNERRKRKHALEDREQEVRQSEADTKYQRLAALTDQLTTFTIAMAERKEGNTAASPYHEMKAFESMAIMSGDPEIVEAVAKLKNEPIAYEVEFRALLAQKVQVLEKSGTETKPWWRRRRGS